eukprot:TRINITY_DN1327_c0_g1_i6.p1 TRINITY_DN1327_c0_g1~~TRINITY_DN1327_c0_g1_i6.p1  ORF type:complete len:334 (-),score=64.56 TRINITY_DN1327_c0_g1_i6:114-1115(-)
MNNEPRIKGDELKTMNKKVTYNFAKEKQSTHWIGLYDKLTKEVTVIPTTFINVTHHVNTHTDSDVENRSATRADLVNQFAANAVKTMYRKKVENQLKSGNIIGLSDVVGELQVVERETEVVGTELIPFDPTTTHPGKIYDVPGVMDAIAPIIDECHNQIQVESVKNSTVPLQNLSQVVREALSQVNLFEDDDEIHEKCRQLQFLQYLIHFFVTVQPRRYRNFSTQDFEELIPTSIYNLLCSNFANKAGAFNFKCTPELEKKLIRHICIFALYSFDTYQISDVVLASDLRYPQDKIQKHLQAVGCKKAGKSGYVLQAPLQLPTVGGNRKRKIRR